jgi:hypothetical protein
LSLQRKEQFITVAFRTVKKPYLNWQIFGTDRVGTDVFFFFEKKGVGTLTEDIPPCSFEVKNT